MLCAHIPALQTIVVSELEVTVQVLPPILTEVLLPKPVPLMVTLNPPVTGPELGLMCVTEFAVQEREGGVS